MRFYAGLVGDAPYASATVALVEHELPGGHSPGYFAVLNSPLPGSRVDLARRSGVVFEAFPSSSSPTSSPTSGGARRSAGATTTNSGSARASPSTSPRCTRATARGERVLPATCSGSSGGGRLRNRTRGPMYLGYRLGHIKSRPRVFRALVYNKGAAVLHMLRRLVGDETFFSGDPPLLHRTEVPEGRHRRPAARVRSRIGPAARSFLRTVDLWRRHSAGPLRAHDCTRVRGGAVRAGRRSDLRHSRHGDDHVHGWPDAGRGRRRSPIVAWSGRCRPRARSGRWRSTATRRRSRSSIRSRGGSP